MYAFGGLKQATILGSDTAVLKERWSAMTDMIFFGEEPKGD
jgi:hypothetical protein